MYLDYWGLEKNPFDSVPDPSMYFSAHSTVESTVAELLFAIGEGNECLAVVVGEVGLGKTMALRVVLNALDTERYRIAFITNPDVTFLQLLREILGQLKGETCSLRHKEELLEGFNRILFETADAGGKVLVFIDEGNSMRTRNLESLRLLTNMQEDTRNLMTLVLAGQPKLGRMLEHPSRANLFQRIGVYCRLEPFDSPDVVRDYIEHRLERAGSRRRIFDDSAIEVIFSHSKGVPRLINRACKLALKAGETNGFATISGSLMEEIASRFQSRRSGRRVRPGQAQGEGSITASSIEERPVEYEQSLPDLPAEKAVPAAEPDREWDTAGPAVDSERLEQSGESWVGNGAPSLDSSEYRLEAAAEEPLKATSPPEPQETASPQVPVETSREGEEVEGERSLWISSTALEQLRELPDLKSRRRLAGQLAAQQIREHPERFKDSQVDPVVIWDQLRAAILRVAL